MMTDLIESKENAIRDPEVKVYLERIQSSARRLSGLITGILDHGKSELLLTEKKTPIDFSMLIQDIIKLLDPNKNCKFNYSAIIPNIVTNKFALEQIFINLIANAIKYNDKEEIEIEVGCSEKNESYNFYIKDNGRGINPESVDKIFELFIVEANKDRFGNKGNGIGLATVKKLIEGLGGKISVQTEFGLSTTFMFSLEK